MSRVHDYQSFSSSKRKGFFNTSMSFSHEIRYIDVDLYNKPKELSDVNSIECEIEYSAGVVTNKSGISSIDFEIKSIEIEIMADRYPSEDEEYEIDIIPGKNTNPENIRHIQGEKILPTDPSRIEIDMNKSIDPKDFKITVTFGQDF